MTWTPEIALVLEATSVRPNDAAISRLRRRICQQPDWGEVLRTAIPHGVLPLLVRNVSLHAADLISPSTAAQLQRFARNSAGRSQRQSQELVSIISIFSHTGIRVLPFKGPALSVAAYGDAGLRESHDLDLWVELGQLASAGQCLREAGYSPTTHVQGVAVPTSDAGPRQCEFASPDGQVLVELRGHLESSEFPSGCRPEFAQMWARHGWTSMNGQEIPVFAMEDLLIALAVHGSKHMWRRLSWVVDIAAVISANSTVDWDGILQRAIDLRCRRRLLVACALASELYAVELPRQILGAMRRDAIRSIASRILASLFKEEAGRSVRRFSSEIVYQLQICESIAMRAKIGRRSIRRIVRADDRQIFPPMSQDLSLMYRALTLLRGLLQRGEAARNGRT